MELNRSLMSPNMYARHQAWLHGEPRGPCEPRGSTASHSLLGNWASVNYVRVVLPCIQEVRVLQHARDLRVDSVLIRGRFATGGQAGMPTHAKRCSSTRSTPHTRRFVSLTGPPPIRQFTSMRRGPWDVCLHSTWKTPMVRPRT